MSRVFGRNYRLTIKRGPDELVYRPPMQIRFSVDNNYGSEGSLAEVTLYGASDKARRAIYNKFDGLSLSAGFGEQVGLIFSGDIINTEVGREGVDKYIKFYCRVAGRSQANAYTSQGWGENTPQLDVIRGVAESFLLPVELIGDFSGLPKAIKGRTICQSSVSCMNEMAEIHGFIWTLGMDRLTIIKIDDDGKLAERDGLPHQVSEGTGMIGSPKVLLQRVEVSKKLDPTISPGDKIEIQAETRNFAFSGVYTARIMDIDPAGGSGTYSVLNVQHKGDFYGDTWDTSITGVRR